MLRLPCFRSLRPSLIRRLLPLLPAIQLWTLSPTLQPLKHDKDPHKASTNADTEVDTLARTADNYGDVSDPLEHRQQQHQEHDSENMSAGASEPALLRPQQPVQSALSSALSQLLQALLRACSVQQSDTDSDSDVDDDTQSNAYDNGADGLGMGQHVVVRLLGQRLFHSLEGVRRDASRALYAYYRQWSQCVLTDGTGGDEEIYRDPIGRLLSEQSPEAEENESEKENELIARSLLETPLLLSTARPRPQPTPEPGGDAHPPTTDTAAAVEIGTRPGSSRLQSHMRCITDTHNLLGLVASRTLSSDVRRTALNQLVSSVANLLSTTLRWGAKDVAAGLQVAAAIVRVTLLLLRQHHACSKSETEAGSPSDSRLGEAVRKSCQLLLLLRLSVSWSWALCCMRSSGSDSASSFETCLQKPFRDTAGVLTLVPLLFGRSSPACARAVVAEVLARVFFASPQKVPEGVTDELS